MSATAEALKCQLLALEDGERLALAEFLFDSLPDDEYDEAFLKELNRRSDEIDAGTAKGRDLDEIMAELGPRFG